MSQLSLSRDRMVGMPHYKWASLESNASGAGTYVYNFIRKPPPIDESYKKYGAFHGAEIAYALDNLSASNRSWETIDHHLAEIMSAYWVNFATTGNPNGDQLPYWPKYDDADNMVMVLKEEPATERLPNKEVLDILYARIGK